MKNIKTLIEDVYNVAGREPEEWFGSEPELQRYCGELGRCIYQGFTKTHPRGTLRLSAMGEKCPRSLWASVRAPSLQTKFRPNTRIIFRYGDVIEQLALALAKAAGHTVTGEQDELILNGVKGHRDAVIDGCIVDVKSVSSLGFKDVKAGNISENPFLRGYLDQLDGYAVASLDDDLVVTKDKAYLWFVDKQLGHMYLHEHTVRADRIRQRVDDYKAIILCEEPPHCTCKTVQERDTGNIKLDTQAAYNPYKHFCFPNLRTFIVKGKPVDYVTVFRRPAGAIEVDKHS